MAEDVRFETEAFLVKDDSLCVADSAFVKWMREEGFRTAYYKGCWGCSWMFVSITTKRYAYGMPGIKIVTPTGNHAITLDEFMTIYEIYKKYEGLNPLEFEQQEQKGVAQKRNTVK